MSNRVRLSPATVRERSILRRAAALAAVLFLLAHTDQPSAKSARPPNEQVISALIQRRAYAEAFTACQQLLISSPEADWGYTRFVELALETKRVDEAVRFVEKLPKQSPAQQSLQHYCLAALYFPWVVPNAANYQRVAEHCLQSLALNPAFVRPYALLVEAQLALKQQAALTSYLQTALTATPPVKTAAHYALGYLYKQTRDFDASLGQLNEALALAPDFLEAWHEKGAVLLRQRNAAASQAALELGQRLLSMARAASNPEQQSKGWKIIGLAQTQLDHPLEAIQAYQTGLRIAESAGELFLQDYHLAALCSAHTQSDDYASSIAACRRGLEIQSSRVREYNLGNLGFAYRRLGDTPTGKDYYSQALELARQKNNQDSQMQMLTNLGEVQAELKNYAASQTLLQEAVRLAEQQHDLKRKSAALASLGRLYDEKGNYQLALTRQEAARSLAAQLGNDGQVAKSLNSLGLVHAKLGNWPAALRAHQQAAQIGAQINSARAVWLAQRGLAAGERRLGHFAAAQTHYREAIVVQEATRNKLKTDSDKISFWQDKVALYKDLASLLLRSHTSASQIEAFHLSERWRARALLDLLSEANADFESTTAAPDRPLHVPEAQQALDTETVILSYSLDAHDSLLFGLTRDSFLVRKLSSARALNEQAEQLLNAVTAKTQTAPAVYPRAAAALYQQLIAPAQALLAGKRHLIIVPDGALQRLPFELLVRGQVNAHVTRDPAELPYLIKQFAISYAPSVSSWARLQAKAAHTAPAPKDFLAYGAPQYPAALQGYAASLFGPAQPAPLRYSQTEVERIAALFTDKQLYFGATATEANVKRNAQLDQYRFVHFSLHAGANGLLLSQMPDTKLEQEDGVLTADEIVNLRLRAELVSLSACETGLGKQVNGEGLMGLMRAFLYAGTSAVAVSLWKVDEQAAADLMARFYRYLLHGQTLPTGEHVKLNKAQALQQARLDMIRDGSSPYFWAPFVLVGQP